ncbi:MAG TPA: hypothetical protein K8W08_00730 [Empedobacter falsenii]|nr:hypothetical protein [Empedobacter falsenii]
MTFEDLFNLIERNNFKSKNDFIVAVKLFDAENDWPEPSTTLEEFIGKLEYEIGEEIFYHRLISKLETYSLTNDAWKIESLMSIKDIVDLDLNKSLRTIVNEFVANNETI